MSLNSLQESTKPNAMNRGAIIQGIAQQQIKAAKNPLPKIISTGDNVIVHWQVREGEKSRIQPFEGTIIAQRHTQVKSPGASITVRKISHGVGVERVFPLHAPALEKLEIKRSGQVRRAKLYYLRELSGKAARIKERIVKRTTTGENQ